MEQKIERAVDSGLESISAWLHMAGIGFGMVLILFGAFLLLNNKGAQAKKSIANVGLASLALGVVAILSALVQMSQTL